MIKGLRSLLPLPFFLGLAAATDGTALSSPQFCDTEIRPAAPGFQSNFGSAVALRGDYAIVGAPRDSGGATCASGVPSGGSASIFELVDGEWVEAARLTSPNPECEGQFGYEVAVSGNFALVGAPFEDVAGIPDAGRAYVYRRTNNGWVFDQTLTELSPSSSSRFGHSVDMLGARMAIGAIQSDFFGANAGAVQMYRYQGTQWIFEDRVGPNPPTQGGFFGTSVSISGDYCAVGAVYDNDAGFQAGAAYIFQRQLNTTWNQDVKLIPPVVGDRSFYGIAVEYTGGRVVVGAEGMDNGAPDSGTAFVYRRTSAGPWLLEQELASGAPENDGAFGRSVAITGGGIVVSDVTVTGGGAAYYYTFSQGSPAPWIYQGELRGINPSVGDAFGTDVSLDGDVAFAGAPLRFTSVPLSGAVFSYDLQFDDCDGDGMNDFCVLQSNPALDCDGDGELDSCEISANPGLDCDGNGVIDSCDIAANGSLDCNGNGLLDACEVLDDPSVDCDGNGVIDSCDAAAGNVQDVNGNMIPDTCEEIGMATGCQTVPNSTGVVSVLAAIGSERIVENDLTLLGSNIPINTFGYPILSRTSASVIPNNAVGFRCVGGSVGRDFSNIFNSGPSGTAVLAMDVNALPQPGGLSMAMAGESWFFQLWHRDSFGGFVSSTFSDSVRITFQ